jgi:hypothetical protein
MDLNLTLFKFNFGGKKRKVVKTINNPQQDKNLISAIKTKLEKTLPKDKKRKLDDFTEPFVYKIEIYNNGTMVCFAQSNDKKANIQIKLEPYEYANF